MIKVFCCLSAPACLELENVKILELDEVKKASLWAADVTKSV